MIGKTLCGGCKSLIAMGRSGASDSVPIPILAPLRNEPYRQLLFDNLSYPAPEGSPSRLASAS